MAKRAGGGAPSPRGASAARSGEDRVSAMTALPQLDLAAQSAAQWVDDLERRLGWRERDKVYFVLVAALHALRDSLPPQEAVFLAEYLSPLVRGLYYEDWRMTKRSRSAKTRDAFLERIRDGVHHDAGIDADEVGHAVLALVAAHLPASELENVKAATPKELRAFWPA
ncbi:MAG: DUF2267 domain-containing protein [Roseiarcus sp.]